MAPAELGSWCAVGDRLPDQLARIGVGLQEPHDVSGDLAGVVPLDPASEAGEQLRSQLGRVRSVDGDLHGAVGSHGHRMRPDRLLALDTGTVGHPELPVVPGAGEQVAVEFTLRQSVALVGAGVIEGVESVGGSHEADAVAVDLEHLHGADGDVVDVERGSCVHDAAR